MKRSAAAAFLILLILTSCVTSCASDQTAEQAKETAPVIETDIHTEEETELTPELPDAAYGGTEFRIYHNDYGNNNYDIIADTMTGEWLNDIVYQRNLDTEERFDIKLNIYLDAGDIYGNGAMKTIAAGEDAYDVVVTTGLSMMNLMSQNLTYDLKESMPYMDFTKPWWNSDFINNTSLNGKLFAAAGDISHILLESLQFIAFNLDTFKQEGLEPPYDTVRDGTWTFDKMKTFVDTYTRDINGDGKIDLDDQYGFFGHENIITAGYLYTNDVHTCSFENGLPYIDLNLDKITAVWEAYKALIDSNIMVNDSDYGTKAMPMFLSNRILFCDCNMRVVRSRFREMESDFGVVPLPKFKEDIERYNCFAGCEANIYTVPVTASKTDMISAVLEYMAYYGHKNVIPIYYDVILGQKMMRDQDSRDMMQILKDSMYFDFGQWSAMSSTLQVGLFLMNGRNEPASYLEKNRSKMETQLHKLLVSVGAVEE